MTTTVTNVISITVAITFSITVTPVTVIPVYKRLVISVPIAICTLIEIIFVIESTGIIVSRKMAIMMVMTIITMTINDNFNSTSMCRK